MIVSCEASSKFRRTSFQNERFARCFRQFSQKKLPKGSFRARFPPDFTEEAASDSFDFSQNHREAPKLSKGQLRNKMQHQLPFVFSVLFATHANVSMKNTRYALVLACCMLTLNVQFMMLCTYVRQAS